MLFSPLLVSVSKHDYTLKFNGGVERDRGENSFSSCADPERGMIPGNRTSLSFPHFHQFVREERMDLDEK